MLKVENIKSFYRQIDKIKQTDEHELNQIKNVLINTYIYNDPNPDVVFIWFFTLLHAEQYDIVEALINELSKIESSVGNALNSIYHSFKKEYKKALDLFMQAYEDTQDKIEVWKQYDLYLRVELGLEVKKDYFHELISTDLQNRNEEKFNLICKATDLIFSPRFNTRELLAMIIDKIVKHKDEYKDVLIALGLIVTIMNDRELIDKVYSQLDSDDRKKVDQILKNVKPNHMPSDIIKIVSSQI